MLPQAHLLSLVLLLTNAMVLHREHHVDSLAFTLSFTRYPNSTRLWSLNTPR